MKLTDILPVEQWMKLENEIRERSGFNPTICDADGVSITGTVTRNPLCHTIKSNPDGQAFICSPSNHDITNEAKKSFKPVVGVCRSGQAKIVVPIVVGVTFVGTAGGCGLIPENGGVAGLFVSKTIGANIKRLEDLSKDIPSISRQKALDVAHYIKERIDGIISIYMLLQGTESHRYPGQVGAPDPCRGTAR